MDELAARYDAVPYRHGAIPDTHPARLGALARLHGIAAAAPDRCRVLELGCGEGMNLLPLAERLPHSLCTGVDFSSVQIGVAERARVDCSIANVRFVCADLRTWEPEEEAYDYIIAHGLYSWVPEEVQERILALCQRALRPQGVAYLSYNTLPGWGLPGALREVLLQDQSATFETAACVGKEPVARSQAVLQAFAQASAGASTPYQLYLQSTLQDMLSKPPNLLFHDDLAPINRPCTFLEFTQRAQEHDLHYLGEARYATMQWEHLPAAMREPFRELQLSFAQQQQYLDVLCQRWLRASLLTRAPLPAHRPTHPSVIRECALSMRMKIAARAADLRPGVPMQLVGANDVSLESADAGEKALLIALAQSAPQRLPFSQLLTLANGYLEKTRLPLIRDDLSLCKILQTIHALDGLDLMLTGSGEWLATNSQPAPSKLMRYEAQLGLSITNRWHEPVGVTPEGRRWFASGPSPENAAARQAGFLV